MKAEKFDKKYYKGWLIAKANLLLKGMDGILDNVTKALRGEKYNPLVDGFYKNFNISSPVDYNFTEGDIYYAVEVLHEYENPCDASCGKFLNQQQALVYANYLEHITGTIHIVTVNVAKNNHTGRVETLGTEK